MEKLFLSTLNGQPGKRKPVWLMRQAGRYLPEYRALRSQAKNFLDLCLTPQLASAITLQPIERYHFDAAIMFADILLIPYALGQDLTFHEGEGPRLPGLESAAALAKLSYAPERLAPVGETLQRVRERLPDDVALIGFCGAPWTVACYMIDGSSHTGFSHTLRWANSLKYDLNKLIQIIVEASESYLCKQIEAGAEALQIFDSWAGLLEGEMFAQAVIEPTKELVRRVKARHPHIPIIGFPRQASLTDYAAYARETGVDAVSLDQSVPLVYARDKLQTMKPVQGNLSPDLLVRGGAPMREALDVLYKTLGPEHIINLGHGVLPATPPEHVAELVDWVRGNEAAGTRK
ncbi:MAG: uroporphyrinogen decarboxylase [Bdellovibrionales bacterium]